MQCSFGCLIEETQFHIFEECQKIREDLDLKDNFNISFIYRHLHQQNVAVAVLVQIEENRLKMIKKIKEAEEKALLRPPHQSGSGGPDDNLLPG